MLYSSELSTKFIETLDALRSISRQMREQGVTVEKLDEAISELTEHHSNIEKIEANIEAIKNEVIAPLKEEPQQNKTAGKFSISVFWIGSFGLVVAIGTLLYQRVPPLQTTFPLGANNSDILEKLQLIEKQLLFPKTLMDEEGEIFIGYSRRFEVATDGDVKFYLQVGSITDWPKGDSIKGSVKIFRGDILLGKSSLKTIYSRSDGSSTFRPWYDEESLAVDVGDLIRIGNVELKIVRILSRDTVGRLVGDESDGIIFQRSLIKNIASVRP